MPVSLVWWTDYILFGGAVRRSHIMAALSPQRPLHVAAMTGRLPEVERLVSEGPSVRIDRAEGGGEIIRMTDLRHKLHILLVIVFDMMTCPVTDVHPLADACSLSSRGTRKARRPSWLPLGRARLLWWSGSSRGRMPISRSVGLRLHMMSML